jgi:exodeoxyribonuclease VII large subunit
MEQNITLFELNTKIRDALNEILPETVWVKAEISEMKENRNGHCYMELAERKGNETVARARAIIWSYTYRMLKPYFEASTGRIFTEGLKIMVLVTVDFHPVYGLSLNIKDIEPAYTVGDIALQRKEIIDRLKSERVFDMNKELALPFVPQRIAVISSKTAAGYQDFISHLNNNPRGFKFYTCLFEAYMQGPEAEPSIINALERIYGNEELFDVVAIIRGGGAVADLSCFDSYELALNVTQFPLPVITGIGHEKDDTIIDMVAHTRLKTPTAVAEFFISGAERFYESLMEMKENIVHQSGMAIEAKYDQLGKITNNLYNFVNKFIGKSNDCLVRKSNKLQHDINRFSFNNKYKLNNLKHKLHAAMSVWYNEKETILMRKSSNLAGVLKKYFSEQSYKYNRLRDSLRIHSVRFMAKEQERINSNQKSARLLDPVNILKRGYTITLFKDKIVKSAQRLNVKDEIETRFSDGKVISKIAIKE